MKYKFSRKQILIDIFNERKMRAVDFDRLRVNLLAKIEPTPSSTCESAPCECEHVVKISEMSLHKPLGSAFLTFNGDSDKCWKLRNDCAKECKNSPYKNTPSVCGEKIKPIEKVDGVRFVQGYIAERFVWLWNKQCEIIETLNHLSSNAKTK